MSGCENRKRTLIIVVEARMLGLNIELRGWNVNGVHFVTYGGIEFN